MVMKMMRKIFCVTLLALLTLGAQGQNNLQPDANYWEGTKYLYKAKTVADLNQAYRYFSKSAQSGHLMGQVMIGYCYELGIMVKKNVEKAKEIYYSAAGKGCFLGYRYLGFYYRHVKDYVKSMVFYAKAANWEGDPVPYGDVESQRMLAGEFVDVESMRNLNNALYWYKRAKDNPNKEYLVDYDDEMVTINAMIGGLEQRGYSAAKNDGKGIYSKGYTEKKAEASKPTFSSESSVSTASASSFNADKSEDAVVTDIAMEHNVYKGNDKGAIFHVDFDVKGMKDKKGMCLVYIYYEDGRKVYYTLADPDYRNTEGHICACEVFHAPYDLTHYENICIFIPYKAYGLQGHQGLKLKGRVRIYDCDSQIFIESAEKYHSFDWN
jgi:hypothetical protein